MLFQINIFSSSLSYYWTSRIKKWISSFYFLIIILSLRISFTCFWCNTTIIKINKNNQRFLWHIIWNSSNFSFRYPRTQYRVYLFLSASILSTRYFHTIQKVIFRFVCALNDAWLCKDTDPLISLRP